MSRIGFIFINVTKNSNSVPIDLTGCGNSGHQLTLAAAGKNYNIK